MELRKTGPSLRERRPMSFSTGGNPFNHPEFSITVDNTGTSSTRKTFAILPGVHYAISDASAAAPTELVKDVNGDKIDFVLKTGQAVTATNANITVSCTQLKIESFMNHLKAGNKFRLYGLKLTTNNQSQFSEVMNFVRSKLITVSENTPITPSSAKSQTDNNALMADLDLSSYDIVLTSDTEFTWSIIAATWVKISLYGELIRA